MSKKVYFSPSDQTANTYVVGNTNEAEQCRQICLLAVEAAERCGIEALTNTTGSMAERVSESNAWGADLHVPVHSNGADGTADGTLLMCYDLKGEGYKASKAIHGVLAPLSPGTDYDIWARPSLYEIRNSKAPCAYVEVAFHDNPVEAQWIIDNKEEIAEALVKGICNYFGIEYVPPADEDKLYVVQTSPVNKKVAQKVYEAAEESGAGPVLLEFIKEGFA